MRNSIVNALDMLENELSCFCDDLEERVIKQDKDDMLHCSTLRHSDKECYVYELRFHIHTSTCPTSKMALLKYDLLTQSRSLSFVKLTLRNNMSKGLRIDITTCIYIGIGQFSANLSKKVLGYIDSDLCSEYDCENGFITVKKEILYFEDDVSIGKVARGVITAGKELDDLLCISDRNRPAK